VLRLAEEQITDNTITVRTGDDWAGYQVEVYTIETETTGALRVEFRSAQVVKKGGSSERQSDQAPLLGPPHSARFLRLLYATRVSQSDHDMVLVGADQLEPLV